MCVCSKNASGIETVAAHLDFKTFCRALCARAQGGRVGGREIRRWAGECLGTCGGGACGRKRECFSKRETLRSRTFFRLRALLLE